MAYEKLNLPNGTVLNGDHLKHLEEGIGNAVAFSEDQGLTEEQKEHARNNIGCGSVGSVSNPTTTGIDSHAEGTDCKATGNGSHAEGYATTASGSMSHAEGTNTTAASANQHVQGRYNIPDSAGKFAHIVGGGNYQAQKNIHTLDWSGVPWFAGDRVVLGGTGMDDENAVVLMPFYIAQTLTDEQKAQARANIGCGSVGATSACSATGTNAHAEGNSTKATGTTAHAEGTNTSASGMCSHTEGLGCEAASHYQHVQGRWNAPDSANKYAHIVGGGSNIQLRYNIHTLDWSGVPWFKGTKILLGGTHQDDGKAVALMPPLVVKITETPAGSGTYTADKTAAEIYEAYTAGRIVFAIDNWNFIYLIEGCDEANALFSRAFGGNWNGVSISIEAIVIDVNGEATRDSASGYCLPTVTAEDNGKTLKVVDGQWALV